MSNLRYTMVTTTSYGSWLPGDARGYVQQGRILPPEPKLVSHAKSLLKSTPVRFSDDEQARLFQALQSAAEEFNYRLSDVSIESWHAHWIILHNDTVQTMVGRLKNRLRQSLNRGRIWTEGYHFREIRTESGLITARNYIARHKGVRWVNGQSP